MTVGLPGVGLGGIFYLLSALLMPVKELTHAMRGHDARWSVVRRQTAMAATILAAIWVTGWFLGLVVAAMPHATTIGADGADATRSVQNALRVGALLLSLGTLALVVSVVQVARFVVPRSVANHPLDRAATMELPEAVEHESTTREPTHGIESGLLDHAR